MSATATEVTEECVTSRDGTHIGFLRQGRGPGLVLVQGAMATAYQFRELAQALATAFTVYTPDRRGRGRSPRAYQPGHDVTRDVEDVDAVLAATGATRVFGLSSGAVITLEAAFTLPGVEAAAAYEPPLRGPDTVAHDGIRRLHDAIERGALGAALDTALRTAGTAPAALRVLPRTLSRMLARTAIGVDSLRRVGEASLRDLLPGVRYDFDAVAAMAGRRHLLARLDKPVLLISGTASPAFLQQSTRELGEVLPRAQHVELPGLGHSGPWNTARGGRPAVVAAALQAFFTDGCSPAGDAVDDGSTATRPGTPADRSHTFPHGMVGRGRPGRSRSERRRQRPPSSEADHY